MFQILFITSSYRLVCLIIDKASQKFRKNRNFLSPGVNSRAELVAPETALRAVGSGITELHIEICFIKFKLYAVE
jgi:hypothetical protein